MLKGSFYLLAQAPAKSLIHALGMKECNDDDLLFSFSIHAGGTLLPHAQEYAF
jgi:hypothetical protein